VSIAAPEGTLASIQALRAAAALAVVAYHALQWCRGGFDVGRAGVDVFFVISGVIMWRITAGRPVSARGFLWRRFTRVAPLYWLASVLVFAIALRWPLFLPEVKPGWIHLAKSLAFIPHLDPVGLPFPTLPPGWTLNYEAVFYLVFAACLWAPERIRARVVVAALATIVAAGFFFPDSAYFMGANPMLLQFAAGVGLGVAAQAGRLPSRAWGPALILGAVLLWTLVQAGGLFTELWRPLVWGVPAVLTVAGALSIELGGRPLRPVGRWRRPALILGDASYAIYLFHLPATAVIAHTLGYADPWLFLSVSMAVSILAGLAARAWIETPLLRALRRT
jgi:exopolysaccharide production protein ExoZ